MLHPETFKANLALYGQHRQPFLMDVARAVKGLNPNRHFISGWRWQAQARCLVMVISSGGRNNSSSESSEEGTAEGSQGQGGPSMDAGGKDNTNGTSTGGAPDSANTAAKEHTSDNVNTTPDGVNTTAQPPDQPRSLHKGALIAQGKALDPPTAFAQAHLKRLVPKGQVTTVLVHLKLNGTLLPGSYKVPLRGYRDGRVVLRPTDALVSSLPAKRHRVAHWEWLAGSNGAVLLELRAGK